MPRNEQDVENAIINEMAVKLVEFAHQNNWMEKPYRLAYVCAIIAGSSTNICIQDEADRIGAAEKLAEVVVRHALRRDVGAIIVPTSIIPKREQPKREQEDN